ncbi:DUF1515 family protein [Pleomorphomonas oryzae]|uniref:DUF1515 family protein n=1 Tax=Pleomorphomonas oryzae TaxID=261934 RepID=UPI00146D38D3|nr:DUF1515 family protein [Pleomorphomonas oryzae]
MGQILVKLGELGASVGQLRDDFNDEKTAASTNRAAIHRRLDEQAQGMADVKTELALSRQLVETLAQTQAETVLPAVDDWQGMKRTGLTIVGFLALGGVSVGAGLTWFSDQASMIVRHWLRIG